MKGEKRKTKMGIGRIEVDKEGKWVKKGEGEKEGKQKIRKDKIKRK